MHRLTTICVFAVACSLCSDPVIASDNLVVHATQACPADSATQAYWLDIRSRANEVHADKLALALADCLASPNSTLRDRVGYELLTHWLLQEQLSRGVKRGLVFKLLPWLTVSNTTDITADTAIARAFSALVLSELVRSDAAKRFLSSDELEQLVLDATLMFSSERDYRGLDPAIGWIHAVAHGSDLLWRLASHPTTSTRQLGLILESLGSQFTAASPPPFVFNEADRAARVVAALAVNPKLEPLALEHWLQKIAAPGDLSTWKAAFGSVEGMYKLHNVKQLLRAIREEVADLEKNSLLLTIDSYLKALP